MQPDHFCLLLTSYSQFVKLEVLKGVKEARADRVK